MRGAARGGALLLVCALALVWLGGPQDPRRAVDPPRASGPVVAAQAPGSVQFGASFQRSDGQSYSRALDATESRLGGLDLVRVFYDAEPEPWPGKAPGRDLVVSFKLDPSDVVDGVHDQSMTTWFARAPRDVTVHWVYWHEPEDEIEAGRFTAREFRAAFAHLARLADAAQAPRLRATLVLMSWTTQEQSGRDWRDFYPGSDVVDVFAWDAYNRLAGAGRYASPEELLDAPREVSESVRKPFAVAELGSVVVAGDDGSDRAAWILDVGRYLTEHEAVFVAYFDFLWNDGMDDYRLRDPASLEAWRTITRAAGRS